MADPLGKIMPRLRYGVIHPPANEEFQRGPGYQLYRLVRAALRAERPRVWVASRHAVCVER